MDGSSRYCGVSKPEPSRVPARAAASASRCMLDGPMRQTVGLGCNSQPEQGFCHLGRPTNRTGQTGVFSR